MSQSLIQVIKSSLPSIYYRKEICVLKIEAMMSAFELQVHRYIMLAALKFH